MSAENGETRDKEAGKARDGAGKEPDRGGKEKISRVSKGQRTKARKKRRLARQVLLMVLAAAAAALAVGAILDIPYINAAREGVEWIGDRLSGSEPEEAAADHLFLTHSQSGKKLEGEVPILLAIYKTEGAEDPRPEVIYLGLFTYDAASGGGDLFLIPETAVAYNVEGEQVPLSKTLQEEGGKDLLCSTVGNMAGVEVDYLVKLEFWDAALLVQGLGFHPVAPGEQTVLVNPTNGETSYLVAGMETKDADRLLSWMLATDYVDRWEGFYGRLERERGYLPTALSGSASGGTARLEDAFASLQGEDVLVPGTGSAKDDRRYLASMAQAFGELGGGDLSFKAVPAVEVLNGCGVPDLGKRVGGRIAALGLPVAGTGGNAKVVVDGEEVNDFTHQASSIICRSENARAKAYAYYLGVLLSVADVRVEPGAGAEVVLVAGKDMAT